MHQLRLIDIAQQLLDGVRRLADDLLCFQRAVVDQATGDLTAVRRYADHHLATAEAALHGLHTDRQQALAILAQRLHRTGVQHQRTAGLQVASQPLLARRQQAALGGQQRAQTFARLEPRQHLLDGTANDHRMRAGARSQTRSTQLGLHAATAQRTTDATCHGIQCRIIGAGFEDQLGIGVVARVGVVHAVAVGEDHQQIGFHQVGYQRGQGVVVAEADFIGDHGVVLVDHRDHVEIHQGAQGTARVEIALAVGEIVVRQQHLCGTPVVLGKARLPGLHQGHLANGGSGLQLVHRARSAGPAQAAHAGCHRAGRYQHQFHALLTQRDHLLDPHRHGRTIQATPVGGQQRASDLHHPAPRAGHLVTHDLPTLARK